MKISKHNCSACSAEFSIKHSMDHSYFDIYFCPFCGADIEEEVEPDPEDLGE